MRRFIILDPALRDYNSHHPNVLREVASAAKESGFSVRVYGHRQMLPKVQSEFDAVRHFSNYTYNPPIPFRSPHRIRRAKPIWLAAREFAKADPRFRSVSFASRICDHDRQVSITLEQLKQIEFKPDDIVFLHSGQITEFEAAFRFLESDHKGLPARLFFELGVNTGAKVSGEGTFRGYSLPNPASDPRPYFYSVSQKIHRDKGALSKLVLGAFTTDVAADFANFLALPVTSFPLPSKRIATINLSLEPDEPVIGILGYQRRDKGYHLVPEIIRAVRQARPRSRFLVHNSDPTFPSQSEVRNIAKHDGHIVLEERVADHDLWWSLIGKCDLILCPYEPPRYKGSYSAIAGEAILSGIPLIGPKDTSLSVMAETYASGFVSFSQWTSTDVADAVISAIDNIGSLTERSRAGGRNWAKSNGGDVFVKFLSSFGTHN